MGARSRLKPPAPIALSRRRCESPLKVFVWSMNCESCDEPKNSLIADATGLVLTTLCGVIVSVSWVVIRSRTTRSIRYIPIRNASCTNSPTVRRRRLPKCSYSSRRCRIRS